jgi:phosphonate transport system ATP-binding protein
VLQLKKASASYAGQVVLRNVSLCIRPGEKVALVGKSGAGKSTLLRLLYEQQPRQVALVPQELGLVKTLSVFHNVYMGRLNRHNALYNLVNLLRPLQREVAAIVPVLQRLDLIDKLFEPTGQLSGGQQQRTAVARALYQGSEILMGDEPVSAVDEHQSRRVLDAISQGHETVVLAMHDTELAIAYSNRIIGLDGGQITFDEPSAGMRSRDLDALYSS